MATLNVKNFPEELYKLLRQRAEQEHRSVAQQVIHVLHEALEPRARHSIFELQGLGREAWSGIDPARHVEQERDSWD